MCLIYEVSNLLKNNNFEYAICGGYAIDLFLGEESRTHGDIDILAYWKDRNAIIEYMWSKGYNVYEMIGDGKVHHITNINKQLIKKRNIICIKNQCEFVKLTESAEKDIYFIEFIPTIQSELNFIEILFNDKTNEHFLYARNHSIKRDLDKAILYYDDIPYLSPELCLLYKSTDINRAGCLRDYELSVNKMSDEQKQWLYSALTIAYPNGHPWNK